MLSSHLFEFKGTTLHYYQTGSGSEYLLLFPGFGQDGSIFQEYADKMGHRFTLILFDLYFHGKSQWPIGETPLEKGFWKELITTFLHQHTIEKCTVGGFSMGAKFALATVEAVPDKIRALILLSPDGLKRNFWYELATRPLPFRRLFKSMILHPSRFGRLVHLMERFRIADPGLLRFAKHQMNTEEKRKRVYYSWVIFRRLRFNVRQLAGLINQHNIDVTLFAGKHDQVVTAAGMDRFLQHVTHPYRFEIIDAGHTTVLRESLLRLLNI